MREPVMLVHSELRSVVRSNCSIGKLEYSQQGIFRNDSVREPTIFDEYITQYTPVTVCHKIIPIPLALHGIKIVRQSALRSVLSPFSVPFLLAFRYFSRA